VCYRHLYDMLYEARKDRFLDTSILDTVVEQGTTLTSPEGCGRRAILRCPGRHGMYSSAAANTPRTGITRAPSSYLGESEVGARFAIPR
jgi:hypothetical protein